MKTSFLSTLTGSFAMPAWENPTVVMIEAAYRQLGLDWRYINCEVAPEDLGAAVAGARAMGWAGFNCSIPHKLAVIEHLDDLGESARIIGAVNTVVRRDGRYIGENTDGRGFVEAVRELIDPVGKRVVLLGAGGAARAVAVELALAGVAGMTIVNRNGDKAGELAELINRHTGTRADFAAWVRDWALAPDTDLVINATSIGLYPDIDGVPALDFSTLQSRMVVADGIPNPPQTALLRQAQARGCHTLDGLGMLINQGAIAIEYWTGRQPDKAVMRQALAQVLVR